MRAKPCQEKSKICAVIFFTIFLGGRAVFHHSLLVMSNTAPQVTQEGTIFAIYCGETVQVMETEQTEHGTACRISYDCGREDTVPMVRLDFLS